jgi:hypothetical protein
MWWSTFTSKIWKRTVVAYFSKTLSKIERNYCLILRKLLSIMKTLELFHKYLYGPEFHLRT